MLKKRVIWIVLPLLLAFLVAGAGIYYKIYPNTSRCFVVGFHDFDQESPHTYVSKDTPPEARNLLQDIIKHASHRVVAFWGSKKGNPIIIYCHNEEAFKQFGSGTPGVAYLTPFQTFVVIGPKGLRTDIMSHELCHVELFQRLGWWKSEFQKPAWFDEGLALMVDYRYSHREKKSRHFGYLIDWDRRITRGFTAIGLDELGTLNDFSKGNPQRKVFAYVTAGMEVSRWLEISGAEGVHDLIKSIRQGNSFHEAYAEVEEKYKGEKALYGNIERNKK